MSTYLGTLEITAVDAEGRVFQAQNIELLAAAAEASEMMDALNALAEVNA